MGAFEPCDKLIFMQSSYYNVAEGASINLMGTLPYHENWYLVTGVSVQFRFRGRGAASRLLKQVCADADREGVTLLLSIQPDGTGLGYEELRAFYARNGFAMFGSEEDAMIREPRLTC